jgi:hypothetical protein
LICDLCCLDAYLADFMPDGLTAASPEATCTTVAGYDRGRVRQ